VNLSFASGFIYNNCICYSSIEIFGKVVSKVKKSKSKQIKDILIDINSFESDEYVIHSNYGIGIFKGCQLIKVLESEHECIKLEYFNKDIVYVPVENIDNITKYGNTDFVELDKLGTTAWQKKKAILKQRSFEYAQKLMHIAAQRALTESYDFALNIDLFNGFLNKFPYIETEDQAQATNDILIVKSNSNEKIDGKFNLISKYNGIEINENSGEISINKIFPNFYNIIVEYNKNGCLTSTQFKIEAYPLLIVNKNYFDIYPITSNYALTCDNKDVIILGNTFDLNNIQTIGNYNITFTLTINGISSFSTVTTVSAGQTAGTSLSFRGYFGAGTNSVVAWSYADTGGVLSGIRADVSATGNLL
jgi:hypothetical protein